MPAFTRQLRALIYKSLLVSVTKHPIEFLLSIYGLSLAILAVLCSIPSFLSSSNTYGIGTPALVRPLAETVHNKLVIILARMLNKSLPPSPKASIRTEYSSSKMSLALPRSV